MMVIVVLGTVVMDSGILLLAWDRWKGTRRPTSRRRGPGPMGRIGQMLEHIAAVEEQIASLEHAVDTVLPETGHEQHAPTPDDVAQAYTAAAARLVALFNTHFHRPPSSALNRFVAISRDLGQDPDHDLDPDVALMRLDAIGEALRADSRRVGPPSGQRAADLDAVYRELRRAVVLRLDSLRPLLVRRRRRRVLRRHERAALVEQLAGAARRLAAADALSRRTPLAALRALAALRLPTSVEMPPDAAFSTGCRAVEAGLRVCAARGDACLSLRITQLAAAVDTYLDALCDAIAATDGREMAPSPALRSALVDQPS